VGTGSGVPDRLLLVTAALCTKVPRSYQSPAPSAKTAGKPEESTDPFP
jgi:hypothetical protein